MYQIHNAFEKKIIEYFMLFYIKGKKKSHKGGHRHFTSVDALAVEAEKVRRQQEWRVIRLLSS